MTLMICAVLVGLAAAQDPAQHAEAGLGHVGLGRVVGAVAQRDVGDLVGEDARQLAFGAGRGHDARG